jgi:hypothetical protein
LNGLVGLVGVCVNLTSGGEKTLATTAYQGRLALVSLPLGAALNKIKSATLSLPSTQGRPLVRLHLMNSVPYQALVLVFNLDECRACRALCREE